MLCNFLIVPEGKVVFRSSSLERYNRLNLLINGLQVIDSYYGFSKIFGEMDMSNESYLFIYFRCRTVSRTRGPTKCEKTKDPSHK